MKTNYVIVSKIGNRENRSMPFGSLWSAIYVAKQLTDKKATSVRVIDDTTKAIKWERV